MTVQPLTQSPCVEGYDPPEGWGWCFVDEVMVDLPDRTQQLGPIPRYFSRLQFRLSRVSLALSRPQLAATLATYEPRE